MDFRVGSAGTAVTVRSHGCQSLTLTGTAGPSDSALHRRPPVSLSLSLITRYNSNPLTTTKVGALHSFPISRTAILLPSHLTPTVLLLSLHSSVPVLSAILVPTRRPSRLLERVMSCASSPPLCWCSHRSPTCFSQSVWVRCSHRPFLHAGLPARGRGQLSRATPTLSSRCSVGGFTIQHRLNRLSDDSDGLSLIGLPYLQDCREVLLGLALRGDQQNSPNLHSTTTD